MAEGYVEPGRCQTVKSGWMDGKHPKVGILKAISVQPNSTTGNYTTSARWIRDDRSALATMI